MLIPTSRYLRATTTPIVMLLLTEQVGLSEIHSLKNFSGSILKKWDMNPSSYKCPCIMGTRILSTTMPVFHTRDNWAPIIIFMSLVLAGGHWDIIPSLF